MSFVRAAAFRLPLRSRFASSARPIRSSNTLQRFGQQTQRKGYASASEAVKESSSDLPWLIGAIAVTIPATWYILLPSAGHDGGHDDHGAHAKHDEAEDEKEEPEEESKDDDESEEKKDDGEEDKDDSADKKDEGEEKKDDGDEDNTEEKDEKKDEKKDGEKDEKTEGKPKKSGEDKVKDLGSPVKGEKKIEEDSKGATKKRIDSPQQKDVGAGKDDQDPSKDKMAKKQAGMSNTPTRHSTDPAAEGSGHSKKGEGTAETAKVMGTVDPGREQV